MSEIELAIGGTPWSQRHEFGRLRAAWRTLYLGFFRPRTYLKIGASEESGSGFFFYCLPLFFILPVVILNVCMLIGINIFPQVFEYVDDSNPWFMIMFAIALLVLGPMSVWVLGWCVYAGLRFSKAAGTVHKIVIRNLVWYLGTSFFCIVGTIRYAIIPFYGSIAHLSDLIDVGLGGAILVASTLASLFWLYSLAASIYVNLHCTIDRVIIGLFIGTVLYVPAIIPVMLFSFVIIDQIVQITRA